VKIHPTHDLQWFEGPDFSYVLSAPRQKPVPITVHVPASSWPLHGRLSSPVLGVIAKAEGTRWLDFGAGSWLWYSQHVLETYPAREVVAVEYASAFRGKARALREDLEKRITLWTPDVFRKKKNPSYGLILLVNVLNTIPVLQHREQIFETVARRLNPQGLLVVYQRVWTSSDNRAGAAIPHGDDGWFFNIQHQNYYTYRAKTGAQWFTAQASKNGLKVIDPGVHFTSNNTVLKVWEKPFT
jgi:hypothetical protein